MKKLIALVLTAVMLTVCLAGCGTAKPADNASASDTASDKFVVGFDSEFPPMGFVDDNGDYVGFDLDLAAEVANRLGKEIVLQPIAWDAKDMELESGNIDCIWNGFTINGREDSYTWTDPYMNNNQVVVVLEGSDIVSFSDLAGLAVAVQEDSSAIDALEANTELYESLGSVTTVDTNMNALMQLDAGAVDAVVMDEIVARYNIEKKGAAYVVLDEVVGAEEFGVGFALGNTELRDAVQNALLEMRADGTLEAISNQWFGTDITTIGK